MNYHKVKNEWKEISSYYQKNNGSWELITEATFENFVNNNVVIFGGYIEGGNSLYIGGAETVSGDSCPYVAILDNSTNVTSAATWSIISGSTYATISANTGELTVLSTANNSSVTIQAVYNDLTATKDILVTYVTGSSSETETETIVDESGNTNTTTTTIITNEDGTTTSTSTTIITNQSGETISSSETNIETYADGSFNGSTTNYDGEGNPTDGISQSGDTSGNISTQEVEYDESGNTTVTGYQIDTSGNPDGAKEFKGDGVNTEYYAFDVTQGFIVDMHFIVNSANSPSGQNENHHNILTAKRASPSPWYGFQLRQSNTAKTITLGTQFSTGSNTNTTLQTVSSTGANLEYNLRIIYNPTAATNSFVCKNMVTGQNVYTSNGKFPDIEALKYIKVTIGYAMDENGDPFRYSDIDVKNFSIRRLENLHNPVISCEHNTVSISCETSEAVIYYKLNQTGSYAEYTTPFTISADTIVEAYAVYCDINSDTVTEVCRYEEETGVKTPVISCDGTEVTITCETEGATIYYRCNQIGDFGVYLEPFPIIEDTVVEAYAVLDEETSETVTETCIYSETHDYSLDYLTFRVKSGGTISWSSIGSETPKAIQYSINNGSWSYLVPSIAGASDSITVSEGDVIRIKGSNASYATSNVNYMGFSGGTAVFDVEGNIMSLVYGDNFVGNTALTGTYNFCSMFKQTNVISAENLILPATTLTPYCYRALFANSPSVEVAPALPATTLADGCYRYIFQDCSITTAPDLLAPILVYDCYEGMFDDCHNLNYIKCLATNISASAATLGWVQAVASNGIFVKDANTEWPLGTSGIPTRWIIVEEGLSKPSVSCDGLAITLECATQGASIYYRLNESGEYTLYSTPISISADTVVEAYSMLNEETSDIVKETCIYDDGIDEPVIYCDGEYVTISCATGGASIYYKFDLEPTYNPYDSAIAISADTICYAYSEIDGRQSEIVSATCTYDDSLKAPIIECDGTEVTIRCNTLDADIYYRLNEEGTYGLYANAFAISADTIVEVYSQRDQEVSTIVSALCEYSDVHDYSLDYLTFDILTSGTLRWGTYGTGHADVIQYSINNGPWTSITASTASTISVTAGDKVRFKGTNTTYAKDKSNYAGFDSGGTATFNIEGNIMSLVYGDNFVGNTALTSTYNFCSIFKQSHCVSAENLILPTTTLTKYCYRAMFSKCTDLVIAPVLPATTLSQGCYWYMFEECAITSAPDLLAEALVSECYGNMFTGCTSLNYIKCMAITGFNTNNCKQNWVAGVASSGSFVKAESVTTTTWGRALVVFLLIGLFMTVLQLLRL